jgi:hypothetical protein
MIFDVFHIVGNTPADKLLLNTFVNDGVMKFAEIFKILWLNPSSPVALCVSKLSNDYRLPRQLLVEY